MFIPTLHAKTLFLSLKICLNALLSIVFLQTKFHFQKTVRKVSRSRSNLELDLESISRESNQSLI